MLYYAVGIPCILGGLSLLIIPLTTNGNIPRWQKLIHWTSAIAFVIWGHAIFLIEPPVVVLIGSGVGGLGCLVWTYRYRRMMKIAERLR